MNTNLNSNFQVLLSGLVMLLFSCGQNTQLDHEDSAAKTTGLDFDKVLKCSKFHFENGIFYTPDYGCIYHPSGTNDLGNLCIYLIPKKKGLVKNENIENFNKNLNSYSILKIKQDFTILIFCIEPKYLNHNPNADPIYYQKESYVEKLFEFNTKQDSWLLRDSLLTQNDSEKIMDWRQQLLNSARKKNGLIDIESSSYLAKSREAQIIFQKECDLNQDGIKDSVFVLKKENDSNANNYLKITGTVLLRLSKNSHFVNFENSTIFPNQTCDYFRTIDIKDNFFTIRLFNEIPDQYVIEKYITFVHMDGNLFLKSNTQIKNGKRIDFDLQKISPILFEDFSEDDERFPN